MYHQPIRWPSDFHQVAKFFGRRGRISRHEMRMSKHDNMETDQLMDIVVLVFMLYSWIVLPST